jgi:hypothetical protein
MADQPDKIAGPLKYFSILNVGSQASSRVNARPVPLAND